MYSQTGVYKHWSRVRFTIRQVYDCFELALGHSHHEHLIIIKYTLRNNNRCRKRRLVKHGIADGAYLNGDQINLIVGLIIYRTIYFFIFRFSFVRLRTPYLSRIVRIFCTWNAFRSNVAQTAVLPIVSNFKNRESNNHVYADISSAEMFAREDERVNITQWAEFMNM